jgi:aspartate ammonia-lyase
LSLPEAAATIWRCLDRLQTNKLTAITAMATDFRIEKDSLGELQVPASAYYGVQTARAVANFPISGLRPHPIFVRGYVMIKRSAAEVHKSLKLLTPEQSDAIIKAADELIEGKYA